MIPLQGKTDFYEKRVSDYPKAGINHSITLLNCQNYCNWCTSLIIILTFSRYRSASGWGCSLSMELCYITVSSRLMCILCRTVVLTRLINPPIFRCFNKAMNFLLASDVTCEMARADLEALIMRSTHIPTQSLITDCKDHGSWTSASVVKNKSPAGFFSKISLCLTEVGRHDCQENMSEAFSKAFPNARCQWSWEDDVRVRIQPSWQVRNKR